MKYIFIILIIILEQQANAQDAEQWKRREDLNREIGSIKKGMEKNTIKTSNTQMNKNAVDEMVDYWKKQKNAGVVTKEQQEAFETIQKKKK